MQNVSGLNSLSNLGESGSNAKWYKNRSYALNSVMPTLIHDYAKNRYYNSTVGTHAFPFTATRTTNATHFDAQGRLVWAPANLFTRSGVATATAGSPGTAPTGWSLTLGLSNGVTRSIISKTDYYMDVEYVGTFTAGENISIAPAPGVTTITAVVGESWTTSLSWGVISGTLPDSTTPLLGGPRVRYGNPGLLLQTGNTTSAIYTVQRTSTTSIAPASTTVVGGDFIWAFGAGQAINCVIRVGEFQLERTSVSSPLPYVETTGSAYYGARLDYNSSTLVARGLLSEIAATNVLTYGRDKGTSFTSKVDITTALTATDVSGVVNSATSMTEGVAGTAILTADGGSITAGSTITTSVLVKSTGASPVTWVRIGCVATGLTDGAEAWFDVANGTLGTVQARGAGTLQTAAITALRDGWYRLEVTSLPNGTYTVPSMFICSGSADASTTRVNNATYAIDYAQIEVGSAATSIIPTYAASATRAADICTLTTGSWLTQTNNTWFARFIPGRDVASARRIFTLSDGTSNNLQSGLRSGTTIMQNWSSIATVQTFGPNTANTSTNFALSKAAFQFANTPAQAVCLNGGTVATSVVAVPTSGYTTLDVGKSVASTGANLNGWILELRNYPSATASGAQLQTLTT